MIHHRIEKFGLRDLRWIGFLYPADIQWRIQPTAKPRLHCHQNIIHMSIEDSMVSKYLGILQRRVGKRETAPLTQGPVGRGNRLLGLSVYAAEEYCNSFPYTKSRRHSRRRSFCIAASGTGNSTNKCGIENLCLSSVNYVVSGPPVGN
jgi:hypothetical protein